MRALAGVLCAVALIATGAQAQTVKDFLAAVTAKWTAPFEPFRLIGNIYYVGTDGIAVYVIKTSQGLILMDTALPQSTGLIKDNIAKLGFKLADIKYILNSHAHFDHTGGFAEIKNETGAQLIAGERDKPLLEGGYYPGDEKDTDTRLSAGEGGPRRQGWRQSHARRHYIDCAFDARPLAWLHQLGDDRQGRQSGPRRIVLLQRDGGVEQAGRSADLSRHRGRLPVDFRQGEGDEARRAARARIRKYMACRRSAPR